MRRALLAEPVHHRSLEPFEADRLELQNLRHVIGGGERIGVPKADERSMLRAWNELQLRFEHDRARALGADQRARDD